MNSATAALHPSIPGLSMFEHYTIGPLRVIIDAASGEVVGVQDALTGCAASLLYSQRSIAGAVAQARNAFQSLYEPA